MVQITAIPGVPVSIPILSPGPPSPPEGLSPPPPPTAAACAASLTVSSLAQLLGALNLSLILRKLLGAGAPRELKNHTAQVFWRFCAFCCAGWHRFACPATYCRSRIIFSVATCLITLAKYQQFRRGLLAKLPLRHYSAAAYSLVISVWKRPPGLLPFGALHFSTL